jgi:hypothetical protein
MSATSPQCREARAVARQRAGQIRRLLRLGHKLREPGADALANPYPTARSRQRPGCRVGQRRLSLPARPVRLGEALHACMRHGARGAPPALKRKPPGGQARAYDRGRAPAGCGTLGPWAASFAARRGVPDWRIDVPCAEPGSPGRRGVSGRRGRITHTRDR